MTRTLCAATPADCPPPPTTPPQVGDYSGDVTTTPGPTFLPDPTIRPHHPCTQEGYDATACQPAVTDHGLEQLPVTGVGVDLALVGVALIAAGAALIAAGAALLTRTRTRNRKGTTA